LSFHVPSYGRYWETVESLRRMFLSGLMALITGQLSQTLASLAVSALYLRAYIAFRPYTRFSDNMVRSKQLVSSCRASRKAVVGSVVDKLRQAAMCCVVCWLGPLWDPLIGPSGSRKETRSHPLSCLSNDLVLHTSTVRADVATLMYRVAWCCIQAPWVNSGCPRRWQCTRSS
jgi:hypothetical protein